MRTRHWMKSLLSGAVLWTGLNSLDAQEMPAAPQAGGGGYFAPPPNYDASTGWWFQGQGGGMPAEMPGGYPPQMAAWPNVSPFAGPPVETHVNKKGFWFKESLFGKGRSYFTVEGLITRTGKPERQLIGANGVNAVNSPPIGGTFQNQNQQYFERPLNVTNNRPDRILDDDDADFIQVFPSQTLGLIGGNLGSGGARVTWGFENPDFSGFEIQGFWQDEASGQGFLGTPDFVLNAQPDDWEAYFIRPFAGLPLAAPTFDSNGSGLPDGDIDGDGFPGTVVPFDIAFQLIMKSETYGANADFLLSPWVRGDVVMIRPVVGARYFRVREEFQFNGIDSGLGYEINPPEQTTGGGGGGGSVDDIPLAPQFPFEGDTPVADLFYAHLRSQSKSHLYGPEVGIRFDLGGENLKIWTQSKVGVLAMQTQRSVDGYNIGDPYNPQRNLDEEDLTQVPDNNQGMPRNPALTSFVDSKNSTSIAPMFEQSVFFKAPVFSYLPGFKKMKILESAQLQAGYTLILIGNMQRPSDIIEWNAWPDNPRVKDGRSTFTTNNASVGIEWTY